NISSLACNDKQQLSSGEEIRYNSCCKVQAQPDWQPQPDEQPAITPNRTNAVNTYNCRFGKSGKNATDVVRPVQQIIYKSGSTASNNKQQPTSYQQYTKRHRVALARPTPYI
nr:hypothetical protein [Tanacetum cinerariifolium]